MKPKITMKTLSELALSMNEVMGLDPPLAGEDYDDKDELQAAILEETKDENNECQIYESDFIGGKTEDKDGEPKFSKNAWAVLNALGVKPVEEENEPPSEPEKKTPPKKKAATEKKEKTEDKKEPIKKPKTKKEPIKKPKTKKETNKSRYTRFDAFADVVKSGLKNTNKISEKANALYVKNGGHDNMNVSKQQLSFAIKTLASFGLASIEKDILKINFKFK